ncbi:MAG TPA: Imm1 family immunity protein [Moraxellaceae bacterium]
MGLSLDAFDEVSQFELSCSTASGASLRMLRNDDRAWLLYRGTDGDAGCHSFGDGGQRGAVVFRLAGGRLDECPVSWCIEVEQCYKAVAYFFANDGLRPDWIEWQT